MAKFIGKLLVITLLLGFAQSSPAPLIYRPGEGWEVEGKDQVEGTSQEQLQKGERFEKEGKLEEAAGCYHSLVKTWPLSPNAPEGQFRFAVMLFKLYDFQRAFKEFQKSLEKYPDSPHFDEILKYQYDIACLFLAGERQKVWKIPTLPSMDKTVEMFEQVIKNGPYSHVAPMAQLKIGFAREKQHLWNDSVKAYQDLIRRYPKSDLADDAQFQIGYAYMQASREADYDQTAANRAVVGFQDYITKYPKSEKIQQARENIDKLKLEQSRGLMTIAEFYDKAKKYDAALVYYNSVVQNYPSAEVAKRASQRADEIKRRQFETTKELKKQTSQKQDPASTNSTKNNPTPL
jgi:outer membrane protein assembly factor BamD